MKKIVLLLSLFCLPGLTVVGKKASHKNVEMQKPVNHDLLFLFSFVQLAGDLYKSLVYGLDNDLKINFNYNVNDNSSKPVFITLKTAKKLTKKEEIEKGLLPWATLLVFCRFYNFASQKDVSVKLFDSFVKIFDLESYIKYFYASFPTSKDNKYNDIIAQHIIDRAREAFVTAVNEKKLEDIVDTFLNSGGSLLLQSFMIEDISDDLLLERLRKKTGSVFVKLDDDIYKNNLEKKLICADLVEEAFTKIFSKMESLVFIETVLHYMEAFVVDKKVSSHSMKEFYYKTLDKYKKPQVTKKEKLLNAVRTYSDMLEKFREYLVKHRDKVRAYINAVFQIND